MDFNPADAGGVQESALLPDGEYRLTVVEAEERISSKGNEMIALTLSGEGQSVRNDRIFEYLVSTPGAVFRIEQFCASAGLDKEFKSGHLTADQCKGRIVKALINTEKGRDGYGDRNRVAEYMPISKGISTSPQITPSHTPIDESTIPF